MNYIVTKSIILINFLMYVQLDNLTKSLSNYSVLIPFLVLENNNYGQLIISNISHFSFIHMFMNMISFYTLGMYLERRLGYKFFLYMIIYFGLASSIIHVFITFMQYYLFDYYYFYYSGSLGFSSIIFGLKYWYYLMTKRPKIMYGFLVQSKYIIWVELLLVTILLPGTSFIGHLSGILAGMLLNYSYY